MNAETEKRLRERASARRFDADDVVGEDYAIMLAEIDRLRAKLEAEPPAGEQHARALDAETRAEHAERELAEVRQERDGWREHVGGMLSERDPMSNTIANNWSGAKAVLQGILAANDGLRAQAARLQEALQSGAQAATATLEEIREFAAGHHGDQEPHVLLHALKVDIPEMVSAVLSPDSAPAPSPSSDCDCDNGIIRTESGAKHCPKCRECCAAPSPSPSGEEKCFRCNGLGQVFTGGGGEHCSLGFYDGSGGDYRPCPKCKGRTPSESERAAPATDPEREAVTPPRITEKPRCPGCQQRLQRVVDDSRMGLSRDQFDSAKAGDWFCKSCKGTRGRSGYRYFWDHEVGRSSDQSERAAPATDPDPSAASALPLASPSPSGEALDALEQGGPTAWREGDEHHVDTDSLRTIRDFATSPEHAVEVDPETAALMAAEILRKRFPLASPSPESGLLEQVGAMEIAPEYSGHWRNGFCRAREKACEIIRAALSAPEVPPMSGQVLREAIAEFLSVIDRIVPDHIGAASMYMDFLSDRTSRADAFGKIMDARRKLRDALSVPEVPPMSGAITSTGVWSDNTGGGAVTPSLYPSPAENVLMSLWWTLTHPPVRAAAPNSVKEIADRVAALGGMEGVIAALRAQRTAPPGGEKEA